MRVLGGLIAALLVVPALAITTARSLPGDSLTWVILRACTPLAIVPYALAAVVLVVTTRGLHGAARSVGVATVVAVTCLLCLHGWWFARPLLADGPGSPSGTSVTVMTANLHIGRADPETIVSAVDDADVDVLVLEEITPSALANLDMAGLDRLLDQRIGVPRTGRDGIMVFASTPLRQTGELGTASPGLVAQISTDRGPLRLLAVHPTAPNNGVARWSADLDAVVTAARRSSAPTLVAGDFNATLDHPRLLELMSARFRDASTDAGLGWRPTWPSPGNVRMATVRIPSLFALDHVFVRGPLVVTQAHTRLVAHTDHRALVTRLAWTD
jgi:endonuclease/exonuclease/phosphatase family metal-dependent hydrolase